MIPASAASYMARSQWLFALARTSISTSPSSVMACRAWCPAYRSSLMAGICTSDRNSPTSRARLSAWSYSRRISRMRGTGIVEPVRLHPLVLSVEVFLGHEVAELQTHVTRCGAPHHTFGNRSLRLLCRRLDRLRCTKRSDQASQHGAPIRLPRKLGRGDPSYEEVKADKHWDLLCCAGGRFCVGLLRVDGNEGSDVNGAVSSLATIRTARSGPPGRAAYRRGRCAASRRS